MRLNSPTECWVGLVLSSPAALIYGSSVTCIFITLLEPSSCFIWRIVSKYGNPSISPTVPPSSTIKISLFSPAL